MSTNDRARSGRAKDSASDNGASKKASAGGRKDGKGKAGEFSVLPKSAGIKEHIAYMLLHICAIARSMRVDLGSSWCLGYELIRIKAKLGLKGKAWDKHCVDVVGKTSRQVRDYMVLAKAFGSAEEMIEKVGETASFANAVVTARALVNPEPVPVPETDDAGDETENEPVIIKPDGGNAADDLPPVVVSTPPATDSDGAEMLDDIIRIASNLADDVELLAKVHAILVKAEASAERDAVADKGCGASKGKAKSVKPSAKKKKKRGKAA